MSIFGLFVYLLFGWMFAEGERETVEMGRLEVTMVAIVWPIVLLMKIANRLGKW